MGQCRRADDDWVFRCTVQLIAICCNGRGRCEQHTSHVTFSRWFTSDNTRMRGSRLKFGVQRTFHVVVLTHPSISCCLSSLLSSCSFSWSSTSSSMMWVTSTLRTLADEDLGTLAEYDPLTGYEPNDLHISETGENRSLHPPQCLFYKTN